MDMRDRIIAAMCKCEGDFAADELADAVLDTLMEPDEGMIEAGVAAFTNVRDIWQAMLTHARSPTEEKK